MNRGKPSVLLIPNGGTTAELASSLEQWDVEVTTAPGLPGGIDQLRQDSYDAVLFEVGQPGGTSDLSQLAEAGADLPILACGPPIIDLERDALSRGAAAYLTWPASAAVVGRALDSALAASRNRALPSAAASAARANLLGTSPQMSSVRNTVARVGAGSSTVLVRGETGTGKELVARALHAGSQRVGSAFIKVHAAALPDGLLESELFGYEKGAFTGAGIRKPGRVELADGGTLFFDEIGEISALMQAKLLRLIEDRQYERLGGTRTLQANIRIVAATHRDLEHMVDAGTFREDLFYRLNVVTVWLPPLRARRSDVVELVDHYVGVFRRTNRKPDLKLDGAALRVLQAQRWPGNVRQLVNFVERLVVLAEHGTITEADVVRELREQHEFLTQGLSQVGDAAKPPGHEPGGGQVVEAVARAVTPSDTQLPSAVLPLREEVRRAELRALKRALNSAKGNRALAARLLGVSRRTLYTKLEEHELE